jgi:hypothetical protein
MPHFSNPIFSMSSIHPQWRGGRTCIFSLYSDHSIYIITRYIKWLYQLTPHATEFHCNALPSYTTVY